MWAHSEWKATLQPTVWGWYLFYIFEIWILIPEMVVPSFKAHGPFKEQSGGRYLGDLTLASTWTHSLFWRELAQEATFQFL